MVDFICDFIWKSLHFSNLCHCKESLLVEFNAFNYFFVDLHINQLRTKQLRLNRLYNRLFLLRKVMNKESIKVFHHDQIKWNFGLRIDFKTLVMILIKSI